MAAYDYTHATPDLTVYPADSLFPDISTVGMIGYPADFAAFMPGYTGSGENIAGIANDIPQADFGVGAGTWSTPQAYSWHTSANLTTDPEIGGYAGDDLGVPFAFGPVESNTVEDFEMRGESAIQHFQTPDVANYGDVGFYDFAGRLAARVASYSYDAPSFEDMASSIVLGV